VCSERVQLDHAAPVRIKRYHSLRADAVAPVIFVREAAPWPANVKAIAIRTKLTRSRCITRVPASGIGAPSQSRLAGFWEWTLPWALVKMTQLRRKINPRRRFSGASLAGISHQNRTGGALQAAEKPFQGVIPIRQPTERNLALSVFNAMRDFSSSATKNGGLLGMTGRRGFSAACLILSCGLRIMHCLAPALRPLPPSVEVR
jgi:hypothetical protein